MESQRGSSLVELVVASTIMSLLITFTIPRIVDWVGRRAVGAEAVRICRWMDAVQLDSSGRSANNAVRFIREPSGEWRYARYEDGDGDGVLNDDIRTGVDKLVGGPYRVGPPGVDTRVWIGFPPSGVNDPDSGQPILPETSPVNFNRSTLCSFDKDGSATPGSVYLTDGVHAAMVRSSGASGVIRAFVYDSKRGVWQ
jgi:type II secretory pathway pseudopilin PulG